MSHSRLRPVTWPLKGALAVLALAGFLVCLVLVPEIMREDAVSHPEDGWIRAGFMAGVYLAAVPFFVALYQALVILRLIDRDETFSPSTVRALRIITRCGLAVGSVIVAGRLSLLPLTAGTNEDTTGVTMLALILTFVCAVVAAAAGLLERLIQQALDLKSENDLTV